MAGFYRGAQNVATLVPGGYFAFMEYAIPQWLRNLEHGIAVVGQGRELIYMAGISSSALDSVVNISVTDLEQQTNEITTSTTSSAILHGVCVDEELDLPDLDEKNKQKEPRPEPLGVPRKPAEPNPEFPKPKRPRIAESPCTSCPKVFNKKYNLISHQAAQTDRRDYRCTICFAAFARDHDRRRHEKTHEHKKVTCGGTLGSGQPWGCQKEFARADTLRNHCSTASGQDCIRPWLDDQGQPGHEVNSGPIVE
ncbi:C2H2 type zinc finger domain-containing protein [Seiridium cupressi]